MSTVLTEFRLPVTSTGNNKLREHNGQTYSGMPIGGEHHWNYTNAYWKEEKVSPDTWKIKFTSVKQRMIQAPERSGVDIGTKYHWYIVGSQLVEKLDANRYQTELTGIKTKIGHKRPYWKDFSYNYKDQKDAGQGRKERIIQALKDEIKRIQEEPC